MSDLLPDPSAEESEPGKVVQGVIVRFGLLPTSGDLWAIAADCLEDLGGCAVVAAAMRAGIYGFGSGSGSGYGSGYGYGSGSGYGSGDGSGYGYGDGDGSG